MCVSVFVFVLGNRFPRRNPLPHSSTPSACLRREDNAVPTLVPPVFLRTKAKGRRRPGDRAWTEHQRVRKKRLVHCPLRSGGSGECRASHGQSCSAKIRSTGAQGALGLRGGMGPVHCAVAAQRHYHDVLVT